MCKYLQCWTVCTTLSTEKLAIAEEDNYMKDQKKRKRKMKMRKMGEVWMHGRGLTQMNDHGNLCKRMNLDFFCRLIVRLSTMHNIVDTFVPSHLLQQLLGFRKALFAIYICCCSIPGSHNSRNEKAAAEMDFKPSRMAIVAKHVEAFIREFFDQNPFSQIGLVIVKDGIDYCLTDLGGSPEAHIKSLMSKLECSGDASLQNALELVDGYLNQIPSYGHREVLIVYSAFCTCDPGDIMETIQKCKKSKIRCLIVGLAAEMFICKHFCQEAGGSYSVAVDEVHLNELLLDHAPPPIAIADYAIANLIKMGFPQRAAEGIISICSCHKEAKMEAASWECQSHSSSSRRSCLLVFRL
ncbi:General transcription factor IIH subunit 2, variant 2 [Ancistrocladus abbreviatus]